MENKETAVEWLEKQFDFWGDRVWEHQNNLFKQAKEMDKEQKHETKQYWFARGILAGKENRIKELKPTKD